jgi:hypothetical protein
LRGHIEGHGPEVDLLIAVGAGNDEEDARTLCASLKHIKQFIIVFLRDIVA